jgi:lauroyl/myristoyl acyltransferase
MQHVTHDHQPQRPFSVRRKLATNVALRAWVPKPLLPAVVASRSFIGRQRPGRMKQARESMRFLLGPWASAEEVDRATEAYLIRATWRIESRWRPSLVNAQEVVGTEHLADAAALGKGVLLSFIHHGDYVGALASIARAGQPLVTVGASGLFQPTSRLWEQQHLRAFTSVPGSSGVDVAIGSAGIRALLAEQRTVGVALDFPGHTPTRMFGRDLMLSSGGTRIAYGLDVPVVPVFSEKVRDTLVGGARVVIGEALQPADYASPETLHAELALQFEKSILAWPEATEEPLRMAKSHLVRQSTEYTSGS